MIPERSTTAEATQGSLEGLAVANSDSRHINHLLPALLRSLLKERAGAVSYERGRKVREVRPNGKG